MKTEDFNKLPAATKKLFDLIECKTAGNVSQFARTIGVKQQSLQRLFKIDERKGYYPSISTNILNKINEYYNYDVSYFYSESSKENQISGSQENNDALNFTIPYYSDIGFGCSPTGFLGAVEVGKADDYLRVPGVMSDGTTFAVSAIGDSMVNTNDPARSIPNGAIVVVKRVETSVIRWGEVYALSTADGCIIKRLYQPEDESKVRCVSYNGEEYPPFDLAKNEIYDIARVVAVLNISKW